MPGMNFVAVGALRCGPSDPRFDALGIGEALQQVRRAVHIVFDPREPVPRLGLALDGEARSPQERAGDDLALVATLGPTYPEWLGDRSFSETHGVRFPYVAGEMANGIATDRDGDRDGAAGMLGFFGAAGLGYARVDAAVDELEQALGRRRALGREPHPLAQRAGARGPRGRPARSRAACDASRPRPSWR